MSTNPYTFVNAITHTKEELIVDDITEKEYNPFMVNRSLSYFPDTVLMANEMNVNASLPKKMQFDFLINIVRKRKRFSKWMKPSIERDIEAIKAHYGYNNERAREALTLLSPDQIDIIRKKVTTGGRKQFSGVVSR